MEIITKLQTELLNSYNNNEIDDSELMDRVKHLKDRYRHIAQLKQSMVDTVNVYVDELCTIDNLSNIHKELLDKHNSLKVLLEVPTIILGTRDTVDEDDEDDGEGVEDEHIKSVFNIMGYHTQLMSMYNAGDITYKVFVDSMVDTCNLDRSVYKNIAGRVDELLEELPSPDIGDERGVVEYLGVSNLLMRELYSSIDTRDGGEELQELFATYLAMLKETVGLVTRRS